MRTLAAILSLSLALVVGLAGCKSNQDDDRTYVEVGDARVYDAPREVAGSHRSVNFNESVPAPKALPDFAAKTRNSQQKVTRTRQYVSIGEMQPD